MAPERDKNWERVLRTAIGFGKKHGRWPTRLAIDSEILAALRRGFSGEEFATLQAGLELVETPDTLRAETDDGDTYHYGESLATRLTFSVTDPKPDWMALDLEVAVDSPPPRAAPEMERLTQEWHQAVRAKDVEALDAIWAEEYTAVGPTGAVTSKAEELATVQSPHLEFEQLDVEDIATREIGTVAIVRSRTTARGSFRGEPINASYRNTVLFTRRGNRWVAITAHSTAIV